ncbi:MAG: OmpA family protein [Bacteroidota bacterium]
MSFNLLSKASHLFNKDFIDQAGVSMRENGTAMQKAVRGIIPTVVGYLIEKTDTEQGVAGLLKLLKTGNQYNDSQNSPGSFFTPSGKMPGLDQNIVTELFEDKTTAVTHAICQFSGIKESSARSLLNIIAPSILGILGKNASDNDMKAADLTTLVNKEKIWLADFMPAGLGPLLTKWGVGKVYSNPLIGAEPADTKRHRVTSQQKPAKTSSPISNWIMILIVLLLAAAVIWYLSGMKGCNGSSNVLPGDSIPPVKTDTPTIDRISGDYIYREGNMLDIALPNNGGTIHAGEYSTEARLINFLNNQNAIIDTLSGNWFEFTNVSFKTGGSEISESSLNQLKNLVLIAKAYPMAQFKIGGYTDNTGDEAANIILSQKRADAVAAMALSLGASKSSIMGSKGYGSEHPIADNATPEGRAMNRRVAVNLKAK